MSDLVSGPVQLYQDLTRTPLNDVRTLWGRIGSDPGVLRDLVFYCEHNCPDPEDSFGRRLIWALAAYKWQRVSDSTSAWDAWYQAQNDLPGTSTLVLGIFEDQE